MFNKAQKYLLFTNLVALLLSGVILLTFNNSSLSDFFTTSQIQEEKIEETPNPTELAKGRNHNNEASNYAYDVTEVAQYISGEKKYDGEKTVFLTIDDGANFDITPRILDILTEYQVHATFFPIGLYVNEENAELYQRQIREGHAIGLHSFYHDLGLLYPGGMPNSEQISIEAKDAQNALKSILGLTFQTRVWRYPGGHMSWSYLDEADKALKEQNLTWIDWNANIGDAEPDHRRPTTVQGLVDFHRQSCLNSDGSLNPIQVVLMHDTWGKELTVQALPQIIQYYKDQGYTFGVLY